MHLNTTAEAAFNFSSRFPVVYCAKRYAYSGSLTFVFQKVFQAFHYGSNKFWAAAYPNPVLVNCAARVFVCNRIGPEFSRGQIRP